MLEQEDENDSPRHAAGCWVHTAETVALAARLSVIRSLLGVGVTSCEQWQNTKTLKRSKLLSDSHHAVHLCQDPVFVCLR